MILVDTSVMIGYLKGSEGKVFDTFDDIIYNEIPFGICPHIYQEVLQGAKDEKEYDVIKEHLGSLPVYELKSGVLSFEKAAYIFFLCRKKGITIRSTIDTLIAQTAIENDLYLLHDDNDFFHIADVIRELKLYH